VHISYRGGGEETLKFFVVPAGTPSNNRQALPHGAVQPPK